MNIPSLILQTPIVDKNGMITPTWAGILTHLITQLQNNMSNEGYVLPQQPTSNLATLSAAENYQKYVGSILYDSTMNQFKGNILNPMTGVSEFKTFTTT